MEVLLGVSARGIGSTTEAPLVTSRLVRMSFEIAAMMETVQAIVQEVEGYRSACKPRAVPLHLCTPTPHQLHRYPRTALEPLMGCIVAYLRLLLAAVIKDARVPRPRLQESAPVDW